MNNTLKKYLQNTAILLLVLIGIKNLIIALPLKFVQKMEYFYKSTINPNDLIIHNTLSFLIGVLMLLLAYRLYKRVRLAWVIEVSLLTLTIIMQISRYHNFTIPIVLFELFVLTVLILTYKDFSRKTDRLTLKKSLLFILGSFVLVIINATIGIFIVKGHFTRIHDIYGAFIDSIKLLVFLDTSVLNISNKFAKIYVVSLVSLNWICIISAVFLFLKPLIYNPIVTKHDREKVRKLVLDYGQNAMAYLALENDKKYFFGSKIQGVCAYTVIRDVFVVCGDMICEEKDGVMFLDEIMDFCKKNYYQILFINVTQYFIELYKSSGFGSVKLGEDCCFKLSDYSLAGGKVAKVRAAINHATKAGITVNEYKPLVEKDLTIEKDIADITEEWLKTKGGYEIQFTIGGTGLWDPLDRRYYYSSDSDGKMLGFVVFLPYKNGYIADVTRRRTNAPQGVLEKIIYEAFMQFKAEGIEWGNMGLSPLYNISESDKASLTEKLFTFVYENLNNGYGFKQLHHAKEKYAPTNWIPRHLAFYPKPFSSKLAYALVRCQFKTGLSKLVLSEVFSKNEK